VAQKPKMDQARLIVEVSRTHTHSRTQLNECSGRRRCSYLHNKHNRRTSMSLEEFEPSFSAI